MYFDSSMCKMGGQGTEFKEVITVVAGNVCGSGGKVAV